jgi:predicted permease
MSGYRPPRWLERVLGWALPGGLSRQGSLGDLAEEFESRALVSPLRAHIWYAAQAMSILSYRVFGRRERRDRPRRFDLRSDLSWAVRSILKRPTFAVGVVAVLGLGLGANVAVFSVVDGSLRNTSWWADTESTVVIWPGNLFSLGQLETLDREQTVYDAVGGYVEAAFALELPDGESESVNSVLITPQLFRELAIQPTRGRALTDDDAYVGVERVAVISDRLWQRSLGSDPDVIGSRIVIGGAPATVVGIQGAGGRAPGGRADVWLPLLMDARDDDYWKAYSYTLVGVRRDNATLDDANTDLDAYTSRLAEVFPMFFQPTWAAAAYVEPADAAQRRMVATPLLLLFAGTALLMLVTALNVGNLLLGRAINRRAELALRTALGASRGRIVCLLLVEGMVLTLLALGLGVASAAYGAGRIAALFVESPLVDRSAVLSPIVLGFAAGIAALAWLVLNGVPIAHYLRTQNTRSHAAPDSGKGLQRALVVVQAALATLLLVSAALLVATVDNLRRVPLGFDPAGIVTVELSPPADRVAAAPVAREFYSRIADAAGALPGVEAVGLTGWLPLRTQAPSVPLNLEDAPVDPREAPRVPKHHVDAGFFTALDVEPLEGRLLGPEDRATAAPSAIVVNATLAEMLWPGESPLGKRMAIDPHAWDDWAPVVGVIPDIRSGPITGPIGPALYVSLAESPARDVTLIVHVNGSTRALMPQLRNAVAETDALVPIRSVTDMTAVVRAAYSTAWVMMGLLIVLAVLASALGAIGIYGVLAHHVSTNRREIAVRMALGAQPGAVVAAVVRSGVLLAGIGIAIGCGVAAVSTRYLESLLFEVSALAPSAFIGPALALALAAAAAAWIPAARAGRLPPANVLRSE